jgi:hypothetical protein
MTERNTQRCSQPADQPDRLFEPHRLAARRRSVITVPVAPPAACTRRAARTSLPTALASSPQSVGKGTFAPITVVSARIPAVRSSLVPAALVHSASFSPATAASPYRLVSFWLLSPYATRRAGQRRSRLRYQGQRPGPFPMLRAPGEGQIRAASSPGTQARPLTRISGQWGGAELGGHFMWQKADLRLAIEVGPAVAPGVVLSLMLARRVVVISEHRRRGWRWPSLLCRTC